MPALSPSLAPAPRVILEIGAPNLSAIVCKIFFDPRNGLSVNEARIHTHVTHHHNHSWDMKTYGSIGEVKTTRGKVHEYLGMKLDYTEKGKVIVDMIDYVESMIQN
jgi:hypothetical protein